MLEDLKHIGKSVHIVLTKIDQVKNNEALLQTLNETKSVTQQFNSFVRPEIHLVCAHHHFGVQELRSRIALGFELDGYHSIKTGGLARVENNLESPPQYRLNRRGKK